MFTHTMACIVAYYNIICVRNEKKKKCYIFFNLSIRAGNGDDLFLSIFLLHHIYILFG